MSNYITTGKTIEGNYIGAPLCSCGKIDAPTAQRITVTIDGTEYDCAIYERVIWRNGGGNEVIARFVIVNGTNYEVAEEEDWDAPEPRTYQRYELEAFLGEPEDFDVDAIEAEVRDRWGLFADEELADICMAHLKAEANPAPIREWAKVGDLGELQDGCGNSLVRGEFGQGTWGLLTEIDGRKAWLRCWGIDDANDTLDRLASGWRPVNWQA